jgi:xanthine dehydrogenase accessory factor
MNFATHILSILKEGKSAVLMIVVENIGSSSGKSGFKMIVDSDEKLFGTIGGGIAEFKIVSEAKKMISENVSETKLIRQVHNTASETDKSGMICSGEHTVALIQIKKDKIEFFKKILESIENNEKSIFKINKNEIYFEKYSSEIKTGFKKENPEKWEYSEIIGNRNSIYILGAGHVGLALSKTMTDLDFHVEIFDNRNDLNTFEQNEFANKKHIVDYEEIEKYIPEGDNIFVAVMTFSHQSDFLVCRKLLKKDFKYFGMLASKNKLKTIKEKLSEEGFSKAELNKIYSPIGIDIKSETPAEIAISIAAQIIEIKHRFEI